MMMKSRTSNSKILFWWGTLTFFLNLLVEGLTVNYNWLDTIISYIWNIIYYTWLIFIILYKNGRGWPSGPVQKLKSSGSNVKVVLGGYPRCPDNHDLSKFHHLYDLGRHYHLTPISLTVSTLTHKNYPWETP